MYCWCVPAPALSEQELNLLFLSSPYVQVYRPVIFIFQNVLVLS